MQTWEAEARGRLSFSVNSTICLTKFRSRWLYSLVVFSYKGQVQTCYLSSNTSITIWNKKLNTYCDLNLCLIEDHQLIELRVHPRCSSQLVLNGSIGRSQGATLNPVQQLWTVCINLVAETSTSSSCLTLDSEWLRLGLSLMTSQLVEHLVDLLEMAEVPVVT